MRQESRIEVNRGYRCGGCYSQADGMRRRRVRREIEKSREVFRRVGVFRRKNDEREVIEARRRFR